MNTLVSIVICTFNRAEILDRCLNSLKDYEAPSYSLELLIVDNNSSDNTQEIVTRFKEGIQNRFPVEYLVEPTVGLSHARNKGVSEAQSPWIFFLDDDAMITAHFYTELERCIKAEYDAFTGVFDPYYIGDKPSWLHTSYGSKGSFKSDLSDLEDDYLCGGVMGFKTEVLKKVGGFPSGLGMAGAKVFYGEETFVERQLRKQNYKLGVNPKLRILHLVSQKKYSFRWNLKSAKAIGKSQSWKDLLILI